MSHGDKPVQPATRQDGKKKPAAEGMGASEGMTAAKVMSHLAGLGLVVGMMDAGEASEAAGGRKTQEASVEPVAILPKNRINPSRSFKPR